MQTYLANLMQKQVFGQYIQTKTLNCKHYFGLHLVDTAEMPAIWTSVSQDLFQAKMGQILEGLKGVVSIAHDIAFFGESEEEDDRNLINLMEMCS